MFLFPFQAYKDGWYTRYETIAFALTKCLMLGGELVKEAGYKAAAEVCTTPEQLMLFNKFTRLLKTGLFISVLYSNKIQLQSL